MKKENWNILKKHGITPEGLSVGGSLDLEGTQITQLPEGLSVGGSLYLEGTQITQLPEGLSVGGSLDLEGTQITQLPQGLSVGGSLYLEGTQINYPFVENCGRSNRTIYLVLGDWSKVQIGCFRGTKEQAKNAICNKYKGREMREYLSKLDEVFNKAKI